MSIASELRNFVSPLLLGASLMITGCASGPPTGWVQKDKAAGTGVLIYWDGDRYEGQVANDKPHGKGKLLYVESPRGYPPTNRPHQFDGGVFEAEFAAGYFADKDLVYRSPKRSSQEAFVYTGRYKNGFDGKGVVVFADGRRFEGTFSNSAKPFVYHTRDSFAWSTSTALGSKFSGEGRMTWPDGSEFVGVAHDYYLFNQGSSNAYCSHSWFYGNGVLRRPGKPEYVGLVTEGYHHNEVGPTTRKAFESYVDSQVECMEEVARDRSTTTQARNEYDASMSKARRDASAMLQRDLAAMPARMANDMANVSAASRGTSVAEERAKRERDTTFYARVAEEKDNPDSDLNRARRAQERKQEQERQDTRRAEESRKAKLDAERDKRTPSEKKSASTAEAEEKTKAAEKKREEDKAAKDKKDRDDKRIADEKDRRDKLEATERKRKAEADEARKKADEEKLARDEANRKSQYLSGISQQLKLAARTCPGGDGRHFVVGLLPKAEKRPVSCLDVHFSAACPGDRSGTQGVIKSFVGIGTDCFMGDTQAINPTPSCKAAEVKVRVEKVVECQ